LWIGDQSNRTGGDFFGRFNFFVTSSGLLAVGWASGLVWGETGTAAASCGKAAVRAAEDSVSPAAVLGFFLRDKFKDLHSQRFTFQLRSSSDS
jgi:hypothetical protein